MRLSELRRKQLREGMKSKKGKSYHDGSFPGLPRPGFASEFNKHNLPKHLPKMPN